NSSSGLQVSKASGKDNCPIGDCKKAPHGLGAAGLPRAHTIATTGETFASGTRMQTTRPIPNCLQKTFREDCLCSSLDCASSFGAISNWSGCYLLSAGPLPTEVVEDHEAAEDQLVSLDVSAVPLFAVASTPGSRYCT